MSRRFSATVKLPDRALDNICQASIGDSLVFAHPMPGNLGHWTGNEMILGSTEMIARGGEVSGNSGAAYNPAHDMWRSISMVGAPTSTGVATRRRNYCAHME